jgi:hypothetical protein
LQIGAKAETEAKRSGKRHRDGQRAVPAHGMPGDPLPRLVQREAVENSARGSSSVT